MSGLSGSLPENSFVTESLVLNGNQNASQLYRNGAQISSAAIGEDDDIGNFILSGRPGGANNSRMDVAEVVFVNRSINSAERNAVDFYMEMKYDLTTSSTGVMLTETVTGNTITSSGTMDALMVEEDITDTHRGSVNVDLASVGMGSLKFLLDFEDTDGTLDTAALLSTFVSQSNDGQFYTASLASDSAPADYEIELLFNDLPSSQAYFNWDTGDTTIQLDRVIAIPEPASGLILALAGLMLGRRRFGK